ILATEQWRNAESCRDLIGDRKWLGSLAPQPLGIPAGSEEDGAGELEEREYKVEVDGRLHSVRVIGAAATGSSGNPTAAGRRPPTRERRSGGAASTAASEALLSPLQGAV